VYIIFLPQTATVLYRPCIPRIPPQRSAWFGLSLDFMAIIVMGFISFGLLGAITWFYRGGLPHCRWLSSTPCCEHARRGADPRTSRYFA